MFKPRSSWPSLWQRFIDSLYNRGIAWTPVNEHFTTYWSVVWQLRLLPIRTHQIPYIKLYEDIVQNKTNNTQW